MQILKPIHIQLVLCNKRSHCNEKPAQGNEKKLLIAATRESPSKATKTQRSRELKKKIYIYTYIHIYIYSITFMMGVGGIRGESWNGSSEIIRVRKTCQQITTVLKHFLLSA